MRCETKMEPGPSDGTAVVKFLAVRQADIGFPSPGVLSFAVNNKMDLVSIYGSGGPDLFNVGFRKGEGVKDLKQLAGKTVLLGSAAWQSIADPMFAAAGVDPKSIKYIKAKVHADADGYALSAELKAVDMAVFFSALLSCDFEIVISPWRATSSCSRGKVQFGRSVTGALSNASTVSSAAVLFVASRPACSPARSPVYVPPVAFAWWFSRYIRVDRSAGAVC